MAMKSFILYLILFVAPSRTCCSVPLMQGRCLHCIWMFYCTVFMWCGVDSCNGLGVSQQGGWYLQIGSGLLEPQSINSSDGFLIPTDHPQCVRLIQPHKLAAPSQDRSRAAVDVRRCTNIGGRKKRDEKKQQRRRITLLFDWLAECINAHFNFSACAHQYDPV